MELTKKQKRDVKDLIKLGINRGCQKWLDETVRIIRQPYDNEENPWDRSMIITKRARDYFKETMDREDSFYKNERLLYSIGALIKEGNLTYEEVESLGEDILAAVHIKTDR